ncbi:Rhamnolipids biosynthesis 3-oxoacyl-[acyl-carrier-protein] reductase [Colletotrichum fructicola Nara gc5]|uniref:Rhamnolipids biosynthesis 3-oxoacyl-[acyl-carrier-protein] reductase n=1 Tax=Colletotrichum fructicola (strain Nara gc5) TaxID=1213859 RepID=L2FNH9_COLFN|nr:Rhamnolipids biosynthesis 3-oxoacyl-[acyl-carrier-protein] reductase [Colletotrichum fructicola Nara gc5]KAF4886098.1 Rhamnolipids biosynthesis 3-oxoacyl-[acyl-carrier-protein] reductase [Colletotrichum fructicola]
MASLRISELFDVAGRWVAITGGASGIGHMLARGCVVNGANVILIDINEKALADTKTELESLTTSSNLDVEVVIIRGDLSSEDMVKDVVDSIRSMRTSLDALIHCAAVRYMNDITYTPGDSLGQLEAATLSAPYKGWEHTFRLNVLAPYYLTAGLISLLGSAAAQGDGRGCVILFSSPASVHNHQFVPCYQTSKAAVDHLVRIMAAEFANFYIRINAMSPGIVPSGMTPDDGTSNLRLASETPAKRAGNEEDMVGCALWLMSKAGAFMDGKVVRVEGGRLLILKGVTSNSD